MSTTQLTPAPHRHPVDSFVSDPDARPTQEANQPGERPTFTTGIFSRAGRQRLRLDNGYVLGGLLLAIPAFAAAIAGVSAGASTAFIWIGIPIMVGTLHVCRVFAGLERRRLRQLGLDAPDPHYPAPAAGAGLHRRMFTTLTDPQSWLELLWTVLNFITSTISFSIGLTWATGATVGWLAPLADLILRRALGSNYGNGGLAALLGFGDGFVVTAVFNWAAAAFFLLSWPYVMRGLAAAQGGISHTLLSQTALAEREIGELRSSRASAHRAESDALRRLERDIHDGPQQRLVRLQMDLARAERLLETNPERAQEVLAETRSQTQDTLNELRQLSRGIAPPVLADRGLAEAIREIAFRSTTPITLDIELTTEPPLHIATAGYYVVSEALANLNKHAQATAASVAVRSEPGLLRIRVSDNGRGGAAIAKGHGLAGLAERLHGVGGELIVHSPEGGPSHIEAVLPCES